MKEFFPTHKDYSRFTYTALDDTTRVLGHRLTQENLLVIKNLIARYAEDAAMMSHDLDSPGKTMVAQARAQGAIMALEHLLQSHSNLEYAENTENSGE